MAPRYRRILIAVDGSDEADRVIEAATNLDPKGDEQFHVVTVIPPLLDGVSAMSGASWSLEDMETALIREVSDDVRERVARFGITPERVTVLYGRPATEIRVQAERIGADLIVVGSHGRGGLSGVVLGSTANGVLHGAKCDVLTVRMHNGGGASLPLDSARELEE